MSAAATGSRSPSTTQALLNLWAHIFPGRAGYIGLFSGQREPGRDQLLETQSKFFGQDHTINALHWLRDERAVGRDVYFCAHLLTKPRRVKKNAAEIRALYVDGDGAQVPDHLPRPTAVVESSPGRQQFYWRLSRPVAPVVGEQLNKRLAYAIGADKSGWDLTQLLRPPGMPNRKYPDMPIVELVSLEDRAYDPDELEQILPPLTELNSERAVVRVERTTTSMMPGDADARIFERMYRGKRGDQLRRLLDGDAGEYRKQDGSPNWSGAEQSANNALVFWFGRDASRVDRAYRSTGLFRAAESARPKWDERHSSDGRTYGEMTIGTAIAGCSQTFEELTGYPADTVWPEIQFNDRDAGAAPEVGTDGAETCSCDCCTHDAARIAHLEAELARLHRARLDQDDKIEYLASSHEAQSSIITAQRGELESKTAYLSHVTSVLAKPNEEMRATQKVVALALANEAHYRADRGRRTLPLVALAERTGLSKATVSRESRELAEREGSPFERSVTREMRRAEDGTEHWVSTISFDLRTERTADTMLAVARLPKAPDARKHGGSAAATTARWRCQTCPGAAVIVDKVWSCATCGDVLHREPLNVQVGSSEETPSAVGVSVLRGSQVGSSGRAGGSAARSSAGQNLQVVDSGPSSDCQFSLPPTTNDHANGHAHHNGNGTAALAIGPPAATVPRQTWRCICGSAKRIQRQPWGDCVCASAPCGVIVPSPEERP